MIINKLRRKKNKKKKLQQYIRSAYSQEGEDLILESFFYKENFGFYVDVGAHHPIRYSNTHFFYLKGWRGINIDVTESVIKKFRRLRTRDINIAAAVGRASESRKLRIYNEPAVNTLSDEFANRVENETDFQLIKEQEVVTISLEEILNKHLPDGQGIEFLSVDVEGMDLEVLQSNNWNRYRPAMVLSEYHGENLEASTIAEACKSPINSFMCTKGYAMVAKTARTMFFQRKN